MNLQELYENIVPQDSDLEGFYDVEEDKRAYSYDDTRKPSITLKQINKLRKYNEFRKQQDLNRESLVSVVYSVPNGGELPTPIAR